MNGGVTSALYSFKMVYLLYVLSFVGLQGYVVPFILNLQPYCDNLCSNVFSLSLFKNLKGHS